MRLIKQKQTRYDSHGHWNTVHDAEITLNDALAILECIDKAYPDAFTHTGGKWKFGAAIYDALPVHLHESVKILMQIADAEP